MSDKTDDLKQRLARYINAGLATAGNAKVKGLTFMPELIGAALKVSKEGTDFLLTTADGREFFVLLFEGAEVDNEGSTVRELRNVQ